MNEVRAEVVVATDPERAFVLFTRDIDRWWRRGERYGGTDVLGHRIDPWVGGRFVEVLADGEHALGDIVAWEPPSRLAFTWRQSNWREHEITRVEVSFTPVSSGTRVLLCHSGFVQITSDVGCDVGYAAGWRELMSWYAASIPHAEEPQRCT